MTTKSGVNGVGVSGWLEQTQYSAPTSRAIEIVDYALISLIWNLQKVGWGAKPVALSATREATRSDKRTENLAMVAMLIAMAETA